MSHTSKVNPGFANHVTEQYFMNGIASYIHYCAVQALLLPLHFQKHQATGVDDDL